MSPGRDTTDLNKSNNPPPTFFPVFLANPPKLSLNTSFISDIDSAILSFVSISCLSLANTSALALLYIIDGCPSADDCPICSGPYGVDTIFVPLSDSKGSVCKGVLLLFIAKDAVDALNIPATDCIAFVMLFTEDSFSVSVSCDSLESLLSSFFLSPLLPIRYPNPPFFIALNAVAKEPPAYL